VGEIGTEPDEEGNVVLLLEFDKSQQSNLEQGIEIQEENGSVIATGTFEGNCSPFEQIIDCGFNGKFVRYGMYKVLLGSETILIRACNPGEVASANQKDCADKRTLLGDNSSIVIKPIGTDGIEFGITTDLVSFFPANETSLELTSTIAVADGVAFNGFKALLSSDFFTSYSLDLIDGLPRYYMVGGEISLGLEARKGFEEMAFPVNLDFKVSVPLTDKVIEGLHRVTGVQRDRYPMLFGIGYTFAPNLYDADVFDDRNLTNRFRLSANYNIPLMQSLDLETCWASAYLVEEDTWASELKLGFKVFFDDNFDNFLFLRYKTGSSAPLFENSSGIEFGISAGLEALFGLENSKTDGVLVCGGS
jgi:hypothetical protein